MIRKLGNTQQLIVPEALVDQRVSESNLSDQHFFEKKKKYTALKYRSKRQWSASMMQSSFGLVSLRTTDGNLSAEFYPPWWLRGIMYARSLHIQHCYSGWKICFRSYSLRRFGESPVFEAAVKGDVPALQKLFDSHEASPFDRLENGMTLLHVSSRIPPAKENRSFIADANLSLHLVRSSIWAGRSFEVLYPIRSGHRCE